MIHSADVGRGVIGVIDVTDVMVNIVSMLLYNCFGRSYCIIVIC